MIDNALVVFARHPVAGRVKRRLAEQLGDAATDEIYRAFLADWADRAGAASEWTTLWAYTPNDSRFEQDFARGQPAFPQRGADLGERMRAAMEDTLARGHRAVAIVGADVPHLPASSISRAFAALAAGKDLALAPAADGGYALIAACRVPDVFSGVDWGTSGVLATTLDLARRVGLAVELLPETFDVDRLADLECLAAELAAGRLGPLPATSRALAATLSRRTSRV
ncbi:MAG: TIGR04282 family arsenosugar biosynthesis glycosyltransferase [Candidatus Binatia bacterium]